MRREELAAELNALDPAQPLGPELHNAVVRLSPAIAIEAVALRTHQGQIEVLLRQRTQDEPAYPGEWHSPGSFVRSGEDVEAVLRRLTERESLGRVVQYELVDNHFWPEKRGWVCSAIYLVVVQNPSPEVAWYPVDDLPEPMVAEHAKVIIPTAVEHYRRRTT